MFSKTYKTTMKTILRSPLVWLSVAVMFGNGVFFTLKSQFSMRDLSTYEQIWDTDSRFVLGYDRYIQMLFNTMWTERLMLYIVPIMCVIVSGVVLTRDLRDNFFEIERAGDVKTRPYFFGRFSAVFTFVSITALFEELLAFHLYYITRRGVPGMTPWNYIIDSNVRIIRMFFVAVIPGILIYIALTFLAANLTKSGTAGMFIVLSYVLFEYLAKTVLKFRLSDYYKSFLTPTSRNLYQYWTFFDTEWFDLKFPYNPFTTEQMLLCLGILYSAVIVFVAISYLCVKKRKI